MTGPAAGPTRIAIVGAGSVGATLAYACLIRGVGRTIALYDLDAAKARAEVLDLNHGLQFVPMATMVGSDDLEVCRGADLVVVTPAALRYSGLPPNRVFGSGTVLDSSRLRLLIAQHCGVAVQNVHAYVAGEHGDSELPLWSSASIGSVPLLRWNVPGRPALDAAARAEIVRRVVGAAEEIIRGKGATNYAVGLAAARIIEAVLYDERQVLPVSSLLDGFAGISDVCLSVPSVIDRAGVDTVLPVPLSDEEAAGLRRSAAAVRDVIRKLGL